MVGELEAGLLALELAGDVEEIARVEADLERACAVLDADLLGGAAALGVVDREHELVASPFA